MAYCPICGSPIAAAENQVCENCRRSSYTAYTDAQGRPVFASEQPPAEKQRQLMFPITRMLVAANIAVFILMVVNGASFMNGPVNDQQFLAWGGNFGPSVLRGESWRLITAVFVHIGFLHLALNMWCLWQLGRLAERLFGAYGYLTLYILTGIAGNLLSIAWNPQVAGAGASGAIFGLAGALIGLLKFARLNAPPQQVKSVLGNLVFFAVANLALGFSIPHVDYMAHIGGLVCGLLIGILLSRGITVSRAVYLRDEVVVFTAVSGVLVAALLALRHAHPQYLLPK